MLKGAKRSVAGNSRDERSAALPPVTRSEVERHLAGLLDSDSFRASSRCKEFLKFVVERTLEGRPDVLKERTIATEVFRRPDYDPATDTLVRVSATELRKRLAHYYDGVPDAPLRIELPTGAYVPEFHLTKPAAAAEDAAPLPANTAGGPKRARTVRWVALSAVLGGLALAAMVFASRESPLDLFWAPVLRKADPLLVSDPSGLTRFVAIPRDRAAVQKHLRDGDPVIPFRLDEVVETDQVVTAGSAHALVAVSSFLHTRGKPPLVRIASQLVPGDVRDRPLIFLGAFNNPWTLELNRELRFAFQTVVDENGWKNVVVDRRNPGRMWVPKTSNHFYEATLDYGLVSRVLNQTGQVVVSAAGITHLGTRAAADFVTGEEQWAQVARQAPKGWHGKNIQVVFETTIVNRTPGPPRVVAAHFW